jgi:DNA-binding HxlR family transcriptional regulator
MIGDKWKVLILRELLSGTKRFGEIRESINGISQKVLTEKLREMESDGLLVRVAYAEIPPRVEYSLTELGMSLGPVLDSLKEWGEMYKRINAES